jgi:hypothetical protein
VTVKHILETDLDLQPLAVAWPTPATPRVFARPAAEFTPVLAGGV